MTTDKTWYVVQRNKSIIVTQIVENGDSILSEPTTYDDAIAHRRYLTGRDMGDM